MSAPQYAYPGHALLPAPIAHAPIAVHAEPVVSLRITTKNKEILLAKGSKNC